MFKQKGQEASPGPITSKPNIKLFCPHCGTLTDSWYEIDEIVLVNQKGRMPQYAKIINIEMSDDGPMVTVFTGGEKLKVHIDYIAKE